MGLWKDKTAVVCGGSGGLGLSIAKQLVRQRVQHLILIARDDQRLKASADQLRLVARSNDFAALTISTVSADLSDSKSAGRAAADALAARAGRVDLLVQAIGQSDRGKLVDLTRQRLIELTDANLSTSLHAIQAFKPSLVGGGVVVLVGSLSSLFAPRFLGGYSIVKHGLTALAQQARLELAPEGVHVMLCCPGPIARPDAGTRYDKLTADDQDLPDEVRGPGGGAKIKGLDPERLAEDLLAAAANKRSLVIYPQKAKWLRLVSAISTSLGDRILRSRTS